LVRNGTSISLHHYELYVSTKIEYWGVHLGIADSYGSESSGVTELYPVKALDVNRRFMGYLNCFFKRCLQCVVVLSCVYRKYRGKLTLYGVIYIKVLCYFM